MKVTEHLDKAKNPLISFEIIPPKRGGDIQGLLKAVDDVSKYNPPFIDITSHAAVELYSETPEGIKRKVIRKRPGTLGICALIQNKYKIDAVPHILCRGFTREETEDFLIELQYLQIENVLAIRGDDSGYEKPLPRGRSANKDARELVRQINNMNNGRYLEENLIDAHSSDFCIGVAAYPEKHFEAPNLDFDIRFLKEKIEAGADYIVTQMFFDNRVFFDFQDKCRKAGIKVPIIPGLKIVSHKNQLNNIPRHFYVDIPAELTDEIMCEKDEHTIEIGVNWSARQVTDLFNNGVPAIHFYIMQNSSPINMLMKKLNL
ncbi:MAG: methylenetetrahydrofolate reductase [Calditrichaceae bacterium]|nr:methylenetetrahydrofolate reductase [Calditrichaceae bacterium]RQV96710.1 MAG: methylenetetrahydrofolate reductase [NAD(P)H] [Calditrichota bacterium]